MATMLTNVANNMHVKLTMFLSMVWHWIGGHVSGAYVLTVENDGCMKRRKKFTQLIMERKDFNYGISELSVFSLLHGM